MLAFPGICDIMPRLLSGELFHFVLYFFSFCAILFPIMKENEINDVIVECFKGGDHYVDIFSKDSMTVGEVHILVNEILKKRSVINKWNECVDPKISQ